MYKRKYSYAVVGNVNWCSHYWKQNSNHSKFKIELPKDPEIPLLGIDPKKTKTLIQKDMHPYVHCSIDYIYPRYRRNLNFPSIDEWIRRCERYYSAIKKKLKMCHLQQLGRPRGYHAQCNKSDSIRQILYNPTYNRSLKKQTKKQWTNNRNRVTDTKSKLVVARGEGFWRLGKIGEGN